MGRWLRHRPGGAGLRSEHLSSTGAMGPSMSWDPWPRPVARAAVGTQECTQIGKNGLSTPFRGTCVHCCAVADNRGYAGVYTDRLKRPLDAGLGRSCTLLRRDSPRQRLTQTPEEPILGGIYPWLRGLGLDRIALRGKLQAKVGGEQPSRRRLPNGSHPPRTRVAKALPSRGMHDGTRRSRPTRWGRVPPTARVPRAP